MPAPDYAYTSCKDTVVAQVQYFENWFRSVDRVAQDLADSECMASVMKHLARPLGEDKTISLSGFLFIHIPYINYVSCLTTPP